MIADKVGLSRDAAKVIGHGWNYGMSVRRMVENEGVARKDAEAFDQGMNRAFPMLIQ